MRACCAAANALRSRRRAHPPTRFIALRRPPLFPAPPPSAADSDPFLADGAWVAGKQATKRTQAWHPGALTHELYGHVLALMWLRATRAALDGLCDAAASSGVRAASFATASAGALCEEPRRCVRIPSLCATTYEPLVAPERGILAAVFLPGDESSWTGSLDDLLADSANVNRSSFLSLRRTGSDGGYRGMQARESSQWHKMVDTGDRAAIQAASAARCHFRDSKYAWFGTALSGALRLRVPAAFVQPPVPRPRHTPHAAAARYVVLCTTLQYDGVAGNLWPGLAGNPVKANPSNGVAVAVAPSSGRRRNLTVRSMSEAGLLPSEFGTDLTTCAAFGPIRADELTPGEAFDFEVTVLHADPPLYVPLAYAVLY